jgi:hypothetical protein
MTRDLGVEEGVDTPRATRPGSSRQFNCIDQGIDTLACIIRRNYPVFQARAAHAGIRRVVVKKPSDIFKSPRELRELFDRVAERMRALYFPREYLAAFQATQLLLTKSLVFYKGVTLVPDELDAWIGAINQYIRCHGRGLAKVGRPKQRKLPGKPPRTKLKPARRKRGATG